MNRRLITRFDVFLIIFVLCLSIIFLISLFIADYGENVVISIEDKIVGEYSINTDFTKEIKTVYGKNVIVISNGECFVLEADCRDGVCVNRGKINKIGESIVCLPHKMIVEIK